MRQNSFPTTLFCATLKNDLRVFFEKPCYFLYNAKCKGLLYFLQVLVKITYQSAKNTTSSLQKKFQCPAQLKKKKYVLTAQQINNIALQKLMAPKNYFVRISLPLDILSSFHSIPFHSIPFIYSIHSIHPFIPFINSFHLFIPFIRSFIHSFIHSFRFSSLPCRAWRLSSTS